VKRSVLIGVTLLAVWIGVTHTLELPTEFAIVMGVAILVFFVGMFGVDICYLLRGESCKFKQAEASEEPQEPLN
jgi:hypothetical protein